MDRGVVGGGFVGKGGGLATVGEPYLGNSGQALGELRVGRTWGQSVKRGVWAGSLRIWEVKECRRACLTL